MAKSELMQTSQSFGGQLGADDVSCCRAELEFGKCACDKQTRMPPPEQRVNQRITTGMHRKTKVDGRVIQPRTARASRFKSGGKDYSAATYSLAVVQMQDATIARHVYCLDSAGDHDHTQAS